MKYLAVFLLALTACITNPATGKREPNYPLIHSELTLISQDIADYGAAYGSSETLNKISQSLMLVDSVVVALQNGEGDSMDLLVVIDQVLGVLPDVTAVFDPDPAKQQRLRGIVFLVRAGLRHAKSVASAK